MVTSGLCYVWGTVLCSGLLKRVRSSLSKVWALEWDRAEFESGFFTYQLFDLGLILLSEPQLPCLNNGDNDT